MQVIVHVVVLYAVIVHVVVLYAVIVHVVVLCAVVVHVVVLCAGDCTCGIVSYIYTAILMT